MNLRNWAGRTLTMARDAFPNTIDLAQVDLDARSGRGPGDPGFKRRMGRTSQNKVRKFLVDAGLGSFDHHSRLFKAEPPPNGATRRAWISNAYRDVHMALSIYEKADS